MKKNPEHATDPVGPSPSKEWLHKALASPKTEDPLPYWLYTLTPSKTEGTWEVCIHKGLTSPKTEEPLEAWLHGVLASPKTADPWKEWLGRAMPSHAAGYRPGIPMSVYEPIGIGEMVEVVAHAMEVFGNRTKALRWLRTPIPSLDNETPEDMLKRDGGIERVQDVLGRIEHGVW